MSSSRDYYGLKFLIVLVLMMLGLAYASFYLIQNYMSDSFFANSLFANSNNHTVYFLKSKTLYGMYEQNGMDYEKYQKRIKYFKNICAKDGYTTKNVYDSELISLPKHSTLIALDMMSLTRDEIENVTTFVKRGGNILFNFTGGFLDEHLKYQPKNLVTMLTPLTLDPQINTITYDKNSTGFITVRLLSPFASVLPEGKAYELTIYDPLPLFITPPQLKADAYLTNWLQTNYIIISGRELEKNESGLIWHGSKGKGKWIYFNFPSYVFMDINSYAFVKLFKRMLHQLQEKINVQVYPYLDAKSAVFVSEDTEYKFKNLQHFSDASLKHHFPVTAFCVAKLAEKNDKLMHYVAKNKYLEIGSHSFSHKKIVGLSDAVYEKETIGSKKVLEKLTGKQVIGFRPPREEIDAKLIKYLEEGGFKYILNKEENRLYPYFMKQTLNIPRHGTDDYAYFVNLDWNSTQILSQMEHESQTLKSLNGIYTMSTHTHLMNYGPNIAITEKFFAYVNKQKDMTPMNGKMIYKRLNLMKNFIYHYKTTEKKIIITLSNNSVQDINNLKFELQTAPDIKIVNVDSEIIGFKTSLQKQSNTIYTLTVKHIKPKSQVMLFINYAKN